MGWKPTWGADGGVENWTFQPGYEAEGRWDNAKTFAEVPEAYRGQALERITRNYWNSDPEQILQQIEAAGVPRGTALENLYQAYRTNPATANSGLSPAEIKQIAGAAETPESIAQNRQWAQNQQDAKGVDNESAFSEFIKVPAIMASLAGGAGGLSSLLSGAGTAGTSTFSLSDPSTWSKLFSGADLGADASWGTNMQTAAGIGEGMDQIAINAGQGGAMMPPAIGMTPEALTAAGLSQTGPGSWTNSDTLLKNVFGGAAGGAAAGATSGMFTPNTFGAAAGGAAAGAAGNALTRLLAGTATAADYASLAGTVGATGLGLYGANQQANSLEGIAKAQREAEQGRFDALLKRGDEATARGIEAQQFGRAVGAPSRGRFEGSFAPGFTMESDPGYTDALNQSAKSTLHGLSMAGNPAGSPNAWAASLSDLYGKTAYPALQNYRNTNATTGGYGSFGASAAGSPGMTNVGMGNPNAGAQTDIAAAGASGNMFNVLGSGLANLTNPQPTLAELIKQMQGLGGGGIFGVRP